MDTNTGQELQGHPGERQLHDLQPAGTARGHQCHGLSTPPQALLLARSHCSGVGDSEAI